MSAMGIRYNDGKTFRVTHSQASVRMTTTGAIILCGGKSTRMGRDKATLPFGNELMLQRVVRLVSQVVVPERIVCVAASGQTLPALPAAVRIAYDRHKTRGPLEGLAVGMTALSGNADVVYATSCDVPLLESALISRVLELIKNYDIAVPREGKFHHPLAAAYRTSVLPVVERLLSADRLRPLYLFEECRTREIELDLLRGVDPELRSLLNCNRPEDYQQACRLVGVVPMA